MEDYEYNDLIQIFIDILGDIHYHNPTKQQISFDCPTCSHDIKSLDIGDGKGNLEINYGYGVYKCWVCNSTHNTHGSIFKLIRKYGNKKHLKKFNLIKPDNFTFVKPNKGETIIELPKDIIFFKNVTENQKKTFLYKEAINYLKGRNITEELILKNHIGFSYDGKYKNRIIIPSYDNDGILNFYIARSFKESIKPKYLNIDAPKDDVIWNEYSLDWDNDIYLVEGVFDYIFLENSIPLLGKFISEYIFNKIYENATKKIIIIFDPDAYQDSEKLYHFLNCGKLMGRVYLLKLEGDKDVADLQGKINNLKIKQLD